MGGGRQAQGLHESHKLGLVGQLAGVAGRAAPFAVGRIGGLGDMAGFKSLGVADVDEAQIALLQQRLQLFGSEQGLGRKSPAAGGQAKAQTQHISGKSFFHGMNRR